MVGNTGRKRADLIICGQRVGEPSRRKKYDPKYCDAIKMMALNGEFPEIWLATIGIHQRTFYDWANAYPEFEESVAEAWVILESYWTKQISENLTNPDLRTTLLLKVLTSRFPTIWGNTPRGTFEAFRDRGIAAVKAGVAGDAGPPKDRAAMLERIAELTERLKARETR